MNSQQKQDQDEKQFHPETQQCNDMDWIIQPKICQKRKVLVGGLAISNIRFCQSKQMMEKESFRAVLSVCGDKLSIPVKVEHLWIVIDDHPNQNISGFFNSATQFIQAHIQHGNVLVHCRAGISRSTSMVIAYLIKKHNLQFQEALHKVQSSRPAAYPNKGFTKQLKKYARQVRNNQGKNVKGSKKQKKQGRSLSGRQVKQIDSNCASKEGKNCQIF